MNCQRSLFCVLITAAMTALFSLTVMASSSWENLLNAEAVMELSSEAVGTADDMIAIARTQEGYHGYTQDGKHYSYFGDIWDPELSERNKKNNGNWCSEFVSWCLVTANVPDSKPLISVSAFRNYYQDSMYKMYASACNSTDTHQQIVENWFSGYTSKGTLKLKDLKKGDILLICRDDKLSGGEPHHTAVFTFFSGKQVHVIEGNKRMDDGTTQVYGDGTYEAHEVIAVIRPEYNDDKGT